MHRKKRRLRDFESMLAPRQPLFFIRLFIIAWFFLFLQIPALTLASSEPVHPGAPSLSPQQQGEFLLLRKKYDQALQVFATLVEEGTEDSSVFRGLIRAYQGAGRFHEVESLIQTYLSAHPQSSAANYALGYYYYLVEKDPEAQEWLEAAVRLNPENALAWNNWGASLERTKSYTFAVEKVKRAIALNPHNLLYFNNLMSVYEGMGDLGLFFAEFNEYVENGPRVMAQGYGKAIAIKLRQEAFRLYSQEQIDGAINKFSEIVEIYQKIEHREGLVPIYFGLAVLYEEKGDMETARKYFQEVLAINPDHIQARERLK